jgi:hypothetical protein
VRIEESPSNIVKLSDIRQEKLAASSPFGPLNPASTTLLAQETHRAYQEARLMELLSSLESVVENLNFKSFTVYDTLNTAIEDLRAVLLPIIEQEAGTDAELNQE